MTISRAVFLLSPIRGRAIEALAHGLSLCTCRRHYPGAAAGCLPRPFHPAVSAFPGRGRRVGLHIDLFEACSAFTHVAACTLARSPIRDPLSEGFSHFVTSMTAPVASGWSGCRVGLAPTEKRRLVTAHVESGPSPRQIGMAELRECRLKDHRLRSRAPCRMRREDDA